MVISSYKILLHREVLQEDSRRFDKKTKDKIKSKCIDLLSRHPDHVGEPLGGELHFYRKLNVFDDYRVIYRADKSKHEVLILAVGIRRNEEVYHEALKRLRKGL